MKIRDIEKRIKKEAERITVPDVYERVKSAPINRLLTLASPAQIIRKQIVNGLFALTVLLFVVMTIGLFAFWIVPDGGKTVSESYIGVTVSNGENITKYAIITDSDGKTAAFIDETAGEPLPFTQGSAPSELLLAFYAPQSGDTLTVAVFNDTQSYAAELANTLGVGLNAAGAEQGVEIRSYAGSAEDKVALADFINSKGANGRARADMRISELINLYLLYAA